MPERLAKKVLLIGWDAADWQLMSPLMDAGKMPALSRVIERGVMGNLATLQPCLSPLLWTSIATGKLPDKHGILGFIEPDAEGGVRPTASTSRTCKAIWNILSQRGMNAHVINWYASHPAEPIRGVCVSNLFDAHPPPPGALWPLPPESVHPPRWCDPVADFRVHPAEIAASDIRAFIPRLDEIDPREDRRPHELAAALAHTAGTHAIATALLENEPWDFVAVYYDTLDVAGHLFMPYHPPRRGHVPKRDFDLYGDVMNRLYHFHDQMLARLLELAGDDVTVLLVSDHGFYSDHRRPHSLTAGDSAEALAAQWHRPFGAICLAGDALRQDDRIHGATLLDVTPTVLTLFGLPVGSDMDGRPLTQAFARAPHIEMIPSWEDLPGPSGMHSPETRVDAVAAKATLERLVSLGYIEAGAATDESSLARVARDEVDFNRAVVYLNSRRAARAIPLLRALVDARPDEIRYALSLARALGEAGRWREAREQLEGLDARGIRHPDLDALHAAALVEAGEPDAALARLDRAEYAEHPAVLLARGRTQRAAGKIAESREDYERLLKLDPESLPALHGLTDALLELGEHAAAADLAIRAVSIAYFFPAAHVQLARALDALGLPDRAIESLTTAIAMDPGLIEAHRRLAALHERRGDLHRALQHQRAADGHV